eukprot:745944-Hanusia_phi.AAC.1
MLQQSPHPRSYPSSRARSDRSGPGAARSLAARQPTARFGNRLSHRQYRLKSPGTVSILGSCQHRGPGPTAAVPCSDSGLHSVLSPILPRDHHGVCVPVADRTPSGTASDGPYGRPAAECNPNQSS